MKKFSLAVFSLVFFPALSLFPFTVQTGLYSAFVDGSPPEEVFLSLRGESSLIVKPAASNSSGASCFKSKFTGELRNGSVRAAEKGGGGAWLSAAVTDDNTIAGVLMPPSGKWRAFKLTLLRGSAMRDGDSARHLNIKNDVRNGHENMFPDHDYDDGGNFVGSRKIRASNDFSGQSGIFESQSGGFTPPEGFEDKTPKHYYLGKNPRAPVVFLSPWTDPDAVKAVPLSGGFIYPYCFTDNDIDP